MFHRSYKNPKECVNSAGVNGDGSKNKGEDRASVNRASVSGVRFFERSFFVLLFLIVPQLALFGVACRGKDGRGPDTVTDTVTDTATKTRGEEPVQTGEIEEEEEPEGASNDSSTAKTGDGSDKDNASDKSAEESNKPLRLVVLVVADQLPAWSFNEWLPLLKHGIRRLVDEGVYYKEARFPNATTFTAVGHAVLATGTVPAKTGIYSNSWYRRKLKTFGSSVFDLNHELFSLTQEDPRRKPGASPRWLRAETVGDMLKKHTKGRGKVVGVSIKDRAAILTGGKKADLAVWYSYDLRPLVMTTSTYYKKTFPSRLRELNKELSIDKKLDLEWRPMKSTISAYHAKLGKNSNKPKGGRGEVYAAFKHKPTDSKKPAKALRAFPYSNIMVLKTALAAMEEEQMGKDSTPDFLAISFSAPDYVGHRWGQESMEMLDNLMRLDRKIETLLKVLDEKVGKGRYAVVFTSDHGAPPSSARIYPKGKRSTRIDPKSIEAAAKRGAKRAAGRGRWILGMRDPYITLTRAALKLPEQKKKKLLQSVIQAVKDVKGIRNAYRTKDISGDCSERKGIERAYCLAVPEDAPGEIFFGVEPYFFMADDEDEVINHGSPYSYDQIVPLVILSPGARAKKIKKQVSALSIAPTLSRLLGVPAPPLAQAPPL